MFTAKFKSEYHEGYSTMEAAVASGFSVRQLDYWAHQGILCPSVRQAEGKGSHRLYSPGDILQLRFILRLKQYGWSTQKVRAALGILRNVLADPDPLKNAIMIAERGTLLAVFKTKEGERLLYDAIATGGQFVLAVVLETLSEEAQLSLAQWK